MITRWVITNDETHEVFGVGFATEKEAWAAQVELAQKNNTSPYSYTAHPVTFEVE